MKIYYWYWSFKLWVFSLLQVFAKDMESHLLLQTQFELINEDFSPKHCIDCGYWEFNNKVTDTLNGYMVCEAESSCKKCSKINGHWAYGSWQV